MKKLGMILGLTMIFGLFVAVGSVLAAGADQLQPASDITYNETVRFPSIYVGSQGVGGVTFFNGTIVNRTTGTGNSNNPVTFGDDVRIDGQIYRTEAGGDNPLKIADTLRPETTNVYDLGTESNVFRNIRGTYLYSGAATITSTLAVGSSATIGDELNVTDYIAVGGGSGASGTTIDTNGNIIADGTVTAGGISTGAITATGTLTGAAASFSGDITTSGDINQDITDSGAVKAMVYVNSDGTCGRAWTYNDSEVTCSREMAGHYHINFDFVVYNRYAQATTTYTTPSSFNPGTDPISAEIAFGAAGIVETVLGITTIDDAGSNNDSDFILTVY